MRGLLRILTPVALVLTLACSHETGPADSGAARAALLQADRDWAAAAARGDIELLTSFWTEDAVDYFPGAPPARGKAEISELVRRNRNQAGFSLSWEPDTAVVARSADLGYTTGSFELSRNDAAGNPVARRGHYLCIWRKEPDGSWRCSVETSVFESVPGP
jgi:ketosteroid isomerase-like protein